MTQDISKHDVEIIKSDILIKNHDGWIENMASLTKFCVWFDLLTLSLKQNESVLKQILLQGSFGNIGKNNNSNVFPGVDGVTEIYQVSNS